MLGLQTMCVHIQSYAGLAPFSRKIPNAKKAYRELRHDIRRLRKNCPKHMDVSWYAESLALSDWDDRPVRRYFDKAGRTVLLITVIAPAHKIP